MRKTIAATLAALVVGAGTLIPAQTAQAIAPARGDGQLVARCKGRVVESGKMLTDDGKAHPTAYWRLYRTGQRGTTLCFQMFDRAGGAWMMGGSIHKADGSYAYENTHYHGKSSGFLVDHAKGDEVTFGGSMWTDDGRTTWKSGTHTVTYR